MSVDDDLRDTAPFDIPMDGIADMVDLMVVVAKSDGRIDALEAESLAILINTLNRSVLDRRVTASIVKESLMRLQREGARMTLERVGQTLASLGKLEDALSLAVDVATSGKALTELEWTSLVLAGRAGQLEPAVIRRIIGDCPGQS
jgi:hypothetical protein